jgi:hypothetical protein
MTVSSRPSAGAIRHSAVARRAADTAQKVQTFVAAHAVVGRMGRRFDQGDTMYAICSGSRAARDAPATSRSTTPSRSRAADMRRTAGADASPVMTRIGKGAEPGSSCQDVAAPPSDFRRKRRT